MSTKSYKIMLLGSMSVGKTSIAKRMKFNTFDANHKSTIGVQLYTFSIENHGQVREIVLWDTDGEYGENIMQQVYIKGSDAAIVVGDATRENTIDAMFDLGAAFEQQLPGTPVLSLINKSDLKTCCEADIVGYKKRCNELRQCSAKVNDGIVESIEYATRLVDAKKQVAI